MTLSPLGDAAVAIALTGKVDELMAARIRALAVAIERQPPAGVVDVVPAFASVAVFYDPMRSAGFARLCAELRQLASRADADAASRTPSRVELPVCYGGEFGPDLATVAERRGLSSERVVALHSGAEYLVHALGFAPGFPYLGGLPEQLATPRRTTPRARVPAGSVGIGGAQTGVYPFASPGGWNLIGRTPLRLFDPTRTPPALLQAGNRVTFRPITADEFHAYQKADTGGGSDPEGRTPRAAPPAIEVLRAGMLTTVQDLGRTGLRAIGVAQGGAADAFALRLANLLVGNAETAAGLEFTLVGPELKFSCPALVALGGAEFEGFPRARPWHVDAGTVLKLGRARAGCRGYLAIAGGIEVPAVLGSRSTDVRAGFGGWEGRALRQGDGLFVPATRRDVREGWRIDERIMPRYSGAATLRYLRGAHADEFDEVLLREEYRVAAQSDRMGLRLSGPVLARRTQAELVSSPVAPGTVQVPPDGQPIVLLADAQTIGGYPQAGHVIAVDQPVAAQLRPGDRVGFHEVTLEEAHELALARERALAMLREGLAHKLH